jgi:hypothetical protein
MTPFESGRARAVAETFPPDLVEALYVLEGVFRHWRNTWPEMEVDGVVFRRNMLLKYLVRWGVAQDKTEALIQYLADREVFQVDGPDIRLDVRAIHDMGTIARILRQRDAAEQGSSPCTSA